MRIDLKKDGSPMSPSMTLHRPKEWVESIEAGLVKKPSEIYRGCGLRWWKEEQPWREYIHRHNRMLTTTESHYLYRKAKELGAGNYLNLGVFRGGSVACMAYGLRDSGGKGKVYGVDPMTYVLGQEDDFWEGMEKSGLTKYVSLCKEYTQDAVSQFEGMKFNLIFIDADHNYDTCKLDWTLYSPLVAKNGVVALHDVDINTVDRVVKEIGPEWKLVDHYWRIKAFRRK